MRKFIMGFLTVVALLFVTNLSADEVQGAVSFTKDSLMISEGEVVYLKQYLKTNEAIEFYWDEENPDNPVVEFLANEINGEPEFIGGSKPGTVTIWAEGASGAYDAIKITVIGMPGLSWWAGSADVGFYPGHVIKCHTYVPEKTGAYRFVVKGPIPTIFNVTDTQGNALNEMNVNIKDGASYSNTFEVHLNAGQTYLLYFGLFTTDTMASVNFPTTATMLHITAGPVEAPTGVVMNVDTSKVIKGYGDHYYILEGDEIPVTVSFTGGLFFKEEAYAYGSTNSSVIVGEDTGAKSFVIRGISSGTADFTLTTTGLLKDTITVTVLDEKDILAGDVDLDGTVTASDFNKIYNVVKGVAEKTRIYDLADINDDGQLDMNDVIIIKDMLGFDRFIDVTEGDWFYDTVEYVYSNSIMTGMDEITFGPYGVLSRAQFALILYRMEGEPEVITDKSFADITGDEWYGPAVLWAAENNIVTGYQDGNFGPIDMITREQMAVMMYRYANYRGYDMESSADLSGYRDGNTMSYFAVEAIVWAIDRGIITGKDNGTRIDPQGYTARAEAATIIMRFMNEYDTE